MRYVSEYEDDPNYRIVADREWTAVIFNAQKAIKIAGITLFWLPVGQWVDRRMDAIRDIEFDRGYNEAH